MIDKKSFHILKSTTKTCSKKGLNFLSLAIPNANSIQKSASVSTYQQKIFSLTSKPLVSTNQSHQNSSQSIKYLNFLQYVLYKDLKSKESELDNFSESTFSSTLKISKQVKFSKLELKNNNHFFPYRKGWINYWLLPFLGFLVSFSNDNNKKYSFSDFSRFHLNPNVTILTKSQTARESKMGFRDLLSEQSKVSILRFTEFEFLTNENLQNTILLESLDSKSVNEFFELWIDNSKLIKFQNLEKWLLNSFENYDIPFTKQITIEESFPANRLTASFPVRSVFEFQDSAVYPSKFYKVPVYTTQEKIMSLGEKQIFKKQTEESKSINFLTKMMKASKNIQGSVSKKASFKIQISPIFSAQLKQKNLKHSTPAFQETLIGTHLLSTNINYKTNLFTSQMGSELKYGKNSILKINQQSKKLKKTPVKDYKKASVLLDQFYNELVSLQEFNVKDDFGNSLQKSTNHGLKVYEKITTISLDKSIKKYFDKTLSTKNFELYYPNSFTKILNKNILLSSLENSTLKENQNLLLSMTNSNVNNQVKNNIDNLNISTHSNSHRTNPKFLDKIISYFSSNNSSLEVSEIKNEPLKLNHENFKIAKKLTKEQLYSILINSFSQNLMLKKSELEKQKELISSQVLSLNTSKGGKLSEVELHSKNLDLVQVPSNQLNNKILVLKLNHPLLFINQNQENVKSSIPSIPNNFKRVDYIEPYNLDLTNNEMNYSFTSNLLKKTNIKTFSISKKAIKNNTSPILTNEKTLRKKEYSSKYITYLSFKLKTFLQKTKLKTVKPNISIHSSNKNEKINSEILNKKITTQLQTQFHAEKIFRSYLSKKHNLQKIQALKIQKANNSKQGMNKNVELKNNKINKVDRFLKSKLRQNFEIQYSSKNSKSFVKNSNLKSSFTTLLKNRAFILKTSLAKNALLDSSILVTPNQNLETKIVNDTYFQKLEKRKYLQKKYRRKKQRKETRRRKKRKRFYPRPTWIRFKLYTNFLRKLSLPKQVQNKTSTTPYISNLPLYSTKEFYQLKTSVIGELKRSFWKSYWLRSNLKPYLNRIKMDLSELKEISKTQTSSLNSNNFVSFILGLKSNEPFGEINKENEKNRMTYSSLQNLTPSFQLNDYLFANKWQLITQVSEYNRIIYDRIQNLILNIRENLNINGQFKARPYKNFTRQKLKSLTSLKQNSLNTQNNDFWIKIEKNKLLRSLFQDSYKYYGYFSNYRLLWAINKSNLGKFKQTNKVKDLWMNTKNRDQIKANKTKKILYQASQNYKVLMNQSRITTQKFNLSEATTKTDPTNTATLLNYYYLNVPTKLNTFSNEEKTTFEQSSDTFTVLEKCLKTSDRKLKQKQQKLRLTLGIFNQINSNNFNEHPFSENTKFQNSSILIPTEIKLATNNYNYWWSESKIKNIASFKSLETSDKSPIPLWVSSFLFHFCTVVSLISISQVRDVIKFLLIFVSKISKLYFQFIYFTFNSLVEFRKKAIPVNLLQRNSLKNNSNFFTTFKFKSIFLAKSTVKFPVFNQKFNSIFDKNSKSNGSQNQTKISFKNYKDSINSPKFYLSLLTLIKKPLMFNQPDEKINSSRLSQNSLQQKSMNNFNQILLKFKLNQTFVKLFFYSTVNSFLFSVKNISFLTYSYFLKTINFVETFIRTVYSFFEKPGELIIDWMAYLFLVEWSSDLTTTIPDTVDNSIVSSLTKYSRLTRFPLISATNFTSNLLLSFPSQVSSVILVPSISSVSGVNLNSSVLQLFPLNILAGSLIQRRILAIYDLLLTIACRPDMDLIIRQQKGQVFWDSWSDLLIEVAEKSNINISELNNLKEEQNRLLEQLLLSTKSGNGKKVTFFSSKTNNGNQISSLTQKNLNLLSQILFKPLDSNQFTIEKGDLKFLGDFQSLSLWKRWSTNQFLSYQGKDTELFIDLHPPKSFSHLTSIKYSQSIQQPIGIVLCQIFSGIFYKQIAKNLLVVGPSGNEKSLLIQAIAGETELKIITDNAYRYSMVFRGVAVGIKLLRDVFEALNLHTPCVFLLEDIHAIGERRPLLISDDENTKGTESSFSTEREEVHEKNQVIYQLTKHIISHYKKPYKGDFSLLIPTNHFCFDLYNSLAFNEKQTITNLSPLSPIPLTTQTTSELINTPKHAQTNQEFGEFETKLASANSKKLASSLQLEKNQLLAPPATSPFSVLVLKEEKKFKPKKLVKELPWAGLPGEQFANISKSTYSIRVKVALLADSVLSNLSVKLDMITDLLVIIDSVKGNRGFVVFATTHVPYILDPALRRPGRFDETLSLPQIPNLLSRWEILNSNLSVWQTSNSNLSSVKNILASTISKNLSLKNQNNLKMSQSLSLAINYGEPFSVYPIGVSISAWENNLFKQILTNSNILTFTKISNGKGSIKIARALLETQKKTKIRTSILLPRQYIFNSTNLNENFVQKQVKQVQLLKLKHLNLQKVYSVVSQILLSLQYSVNKQSLNPQNKELGDFSLSIAGVNYLTSTQDMSNLFFLTFNRVINVDSLVYMSLYSSPHIFKQHLTILMAGQIGQTFARSFGLQKNNYKISKNLPKKYSLKNLEPPMTTNWKTATALVYAFIQKRIIYQKKLIVPKFLNFGFEGSKTDIPSPPASNILLPAKRYENFKRTFSVSQLKSKTGLSIGEKIQIHQQQRLVKRLYKVPLKEYFRSEVLNNFKQSFNDSTFNQQNLINSNSSSLQLNNFTTFSNASIILNPLEKSLVKPSSINWYFRNRILTRHHTYLSNQWWNGQLQEHNSETTFLSDIDWRYSYFMTKASDGSVGDLFIDFPDSEQYYNAKNQRWINTSGLWTSWFDMEKTVYTHSSDHYIYECLMDAFKYLDQNRELLDFYAINIYEKGINSNRNFNDLDILEIFKRFSGFSKI